MDSKLQTTSKTPSRESSLAISHLLKFAFSLKKSENTLNPSKRLMTHNKSLRKKVESSVKVVYKKAWLKIVILLMSALLLINSKRTSKAIVNRYAHMVSPWCVTFSKLKCGVVNSPFITNDCWSFYIFIQYMIENHDLKNHTLFQYPL